MMARSGLISAAVAVAVTLIWSSPVGAQTPGADPNSAAPFGPPIEDTTWWHLILDQFEGRLASGDAALRWEGEAWVGNDVHRIWMKSEGTWSDAARFEDGQLEGFYSTPISTYFDVQIGTRFDLDSRAGRGWAAVGIEGLAPQFFRISATAYASDRGHFAAKMLGTYDLLITQRLILQPSIELNLYSKDDPKRLVGSGLSDLDLGLRLRYEIVRKFAPYIGVTYEKKFAGTADFVAAEGENTDSVRFVVGVRSWF